MDHNHILQSENGVESCPACSSRDEYHLTREYAIMQNYLLNRGL